MYRFAENPNADSEISVLGIPFRVFKNGGRIERFAGGPVQIEGRFTSLYFLGMATESWQCSEWWGQQEVLYDHSTRLFFGDRIGNFRIVFDDETMELVSVIFGVNAFNYNLFYKPKPHEGNLMSFEAPYDEPFRSDENARRLLDEALVLNENTADDAEKGSKWVFCYRPRRDKKVIRIEWFKEDGKRADINLSAVTGLTADCEDTSGLKSVDLDFFLRKSYWKHVDALKHRIYQYKDEIPDRVDLLDLGNFDAPDIRFYNENGLDILTNVYRKNIIDMAYGKITDDGMPHTSSEGTANFGCYIGFGTFNYSASYAAHVWTRDTGRMLLEVTNAGYFERVKAAIGKLHEMLYYPSLRFKIPHWKRIANLTAQNENDRHNEGNENDGHASIMIAIWYLYRKGGAGKDWLEENRVHLKDAADYYLWQRDNPKESNFDRVLYTHSETSSQQLGGYDLYSNVISYYAELLYAQLFDELGDSEYADRLRGFCRELKAGIFDRFVMEHPKYGRVLTDTTDDCWTYEYKRFVPALISTDYLGYDLHEADGELYELCRNTFLAQKDVYYNPFSGRQMGYGQGYLTNCAIALDLYEEYSACVDAAAKMCYHHTDVPYTVPEGVIMHGSGGYWFRNCDLGNAVQQAEIIKGVRLLAGADDLCCEGFRLVPRLPKGLTKIEAKNVPVSVSGAERIQKISYTYERGKGLPVYAGDGTDFYSLSFDGAVKPECVRFGPFRTGNIESSNRIIKTAEIDGKFYAYIGI
ncbi:MAG: hypothetical protein J6U38_04575 [Clostridia bacterium]|nr:hypothetical protein [Clostridia bacterium]